MMITIYRIDYLGFYHLRTLLIIAKPTYLIVDISPKTQISSHSKKSSYMVFPAR